MMLWAILLLPVILPSNAAGVGGGIGGAPDRWTDCQQLSWDVMKETTIVVTNYLDTVMKDMVKLLDATGDYIDPLKLLDPLPFEDNLKNPTTPLDWEGNSNDESEEFERLRKVLFQSLQREDKKHPLIWYALALEPKDAGGRGGYVGLSQMDRNWAAIAGQYWLDSTVSCIQMSCVGDTAYNARQERVSDPKTANKTPVKGLRWARWQVDPKDGEPLYSLGINDEDVNALGPYYEPHTRPWYTQGLRANVATMLTPYQMITGTGAHAIGIGLVQNFRNDGKVAGVLDVEFSIATFSKALTAQRQSKDGLLYIVDVKTRNILAISTINEIVDADGNLQKASADSTHTNKLVEATKDIISERMAPTYTEKRMIDNQEYYLYAEVYNGKERANVANMEWVIVTVWEVIQCKCDAKPPAKVKCKGLKEPECIEKAGRCFAKYKTNKRGRKKFTRCKGKGGGR